MVRVFVYRGKTIEELQSMSIEEFAKLLPSRERRKIKRGFTEVEKKLLAKIAKKPQGAFIKTHVRDMIVLPMMVGRKFGVHNGKEWVTVNIIPEMVGHRLGEFALTCRAVKHSGPGIGATRSSKFIPLK